MVLWLLWQPGTRRACLPAVGALVLLGLALLPLLSAQGGHGTQWIGRWPLSERLQAIPQYYLTGESGAPLGHGVELLVALPILIGAGIGLWRMLERPAASTPAAPGAGGGARSPQRGALIAALISATGILIPVVLVAFGADYLAPRNLLGAMVPLTALIAVLCAAGGTAGAALAATAVCGLLAITIDVNLSPRLQRGNWRALAAALGRTQQPGAGRAITAVELGSAPLQYYLPGLHGLPRGSSALVAEIDETGYAPLRQSAGEPPAPGFRLLTTQRFDGLVLYRFVSAVPRPVSESSLRRHVVTVGEVTHAVVLVGAATRSSG